MICLLLALACGGAGDRSGQKAADRLLVSYIEVLRHDMAAARTLTAADSAGVVSVEDSLDAETMRSALRHLNERPERWNRFFKAAAAALNVESLPADTAALPALFRRATVNKSSAAARR
ncbi:hypothetical protein JXO52_11445 [bacterium]|nr:hypothetical protein [bacterium]